MIITCPNCNKRFNIDASLIPNEGRLLQCSNCNNKWHYKIETKENPTEEIYNLQDETSVNNAQNLDKKKDEIKINPSFENSDSENIQHEKKIKIKGENLKKEKKQIIKKNKKDKPIGLINKIIILVVSIVAIIIVLDTFKNEISYYIPILNPMIDNMYEIILDINSFIKDLFRK